MQIPSRIDVLIVMTSIGIRHVLFIHILEWRIDVLIVMTSNIAH